MIEKKPQDDTDRIVSGAQRDEDESGDIPLRPQHFSDFIGQEKEKANLALFLEAAKKRGEALDHILFTGPPGPRQDHAEQDPCQRAGRQDADQFGPGA